MSRSLNQYPNHKTSNEIKPTDKYNLSTVAFDDMIGAQNCSQTEEFYTRGSHECSDVHYLSQSIF